MYGWGKEPGWETSSEDFMAPRTKVMTVDLKKMNVLKSRN